MCDDDDDDDDRYFESGPFCRHWAEVPECDAKCRCGHGCLDHEVGSVTACMECDCQKWDEVIDSCGRPVEED